MNTIAIKDLHYKWYLKIFKIKASFIWKNFQLSQVMQCLGFNTIIYLFYDWLLYEVISQSYNKHG